MIRVEKVEMSKLSQYSRVEGNPALGTVFRGKGKAVCWWLGIGSGEKG